MSIEFMQRVAAKLSCRTISGREFDGDGREAAPGTACATCGDRCERPRGDLGLAGDCRLVADGAGVQLVWACPGCGCDVAENTTALTAERDAAVVAADPMCVKCRRRSA